ncbi:MAG TPA: CcmD family protein [Terriglobales bacterium]
MDTPHALLHLHLAYIATWLIHFSYIAYLARKAVRLRREAREL